MSATGGREAPQALGVRNVVVAVFRLAASREQGGGRGPWQLGGGRGVSQPYLGPRGARSRPGDMMMDWVSPGLRGMRPLSLIRPSARPFRAGSG
jgi:hypothetical protein